jgi:hypothetical protein
LAASACTMRAARARRNRVARARRGAERAGVPSSRCGSQPCSSSSQRDFAPSRSQRCPRLASLRSAGQLTSRPGSFQVSRAVPRSDLASVWPLRVTSRRRLVGRRPPRKPARTASAFASHLHPCVAFTARSPTRRPPSMHPSLAARRAAVSSWTLANGAQIPKIGFG